MFVDVLSGVSGDVAVKVDCESCEQYLAEIHCQILEELVSTLSRCIRG